MRQPAAAAAAADFLQKRLHCHEPDRPLSLNQQLVRSGGRLVRQAGPRRPQAIQAAPRRRRPEIIERQPGAGAHQVEPLRRRPDVVQLIAEGAVALGLCLQHVEQPQQQQGVALDLRAVLTEQRPSRSDQAVLEPVGPLGEPGLEAVAGIADEQLEQFDLVHAAAHAVASRRREHWLGRCPDSIRSEERRARRRGSGSPARSLARRSLEPR